jgi:hypothetical protein
MTQFQNHKDRAMAELMSRTSYATSRSKVIRRLVLGSESNMPLHWQLYPTPQDKIEDFKEFAGDAKSPRRSQAAKFVGVVSVDRAMLDELWGTGLDQAVAFRVGLKQWLVATMPTGYAFSSSFDNPDRYDIGFGIYEGPLVATVGVTDGTNLDGLLIGDERVEAANLPESVMRL